MFKNDKKNQPTNLFLVKIVVVPYSRKVEVTHYIDIYTQGKGGDMSRSVCFWDK